MAGVSSSTGVSDFAYTTDGRAEGVTALVSGGSDAIGGLGVSVLYGTEPGATSHILAQDGSFITAQNDSQIITQG
jgi:hypothetical protein